MLTRPTRRGALVAAIVSLLVTGAFAQSAPSTGEELREALVIGSVSRTGRAPVFTDPIEARIVAGDWSPPRAGDTIPLPDGSIREWSSARAGEDGWFSGRALRGGYAYFRLESTEARVAILHAAGHSHAYFNGEPRGGDPYGYGYMEIPVSLRAGANDLLLGVARGRVRARLAPPPADVYLNLKDPTAPDLILGEPVDAMAAILVVNATSNRLEELELSASLSGAVTRTALPPIPPLAARKTGFSIRAPATVASSGDHVSVELRLHRAGEPSRILHQGRLELRIRRPDQPHKRTFVSSIDGSVQYYGVHPGSPEAGTSSPPLYLALHGASVEAIGHAEAYGPARPGPLVSPTNRRPYGFDWEDWGRLDALEVLRLASEVFHADPARTYLTGHSMGGHGTWILGATYPDRFAAIGPSAGWISFATYAGGRRGRPDDPTAIERILTRASASSDTLAMATNHLHHGIYILHGDADDNVPVAQARRMREVLGEFHRDFAWHEQPGAGHWWDDSEEPGAACVDWPPMFDFFARRRRPDDSEVRQVHFVTVNPGVSSRSHWIGIEAQQRTLEPSEVIARRDPALRRIHVSTRNVERLVLEAAVLDPRAEGLDVVIDGTALSKLRPDESDPPLPEGPDGRSWNRPLRLVHASDGWKVAGPFSPALKHPGRHGPFKEAFQNRFLLVHGTSGTPEENRWACQKARYDAEVFWYRGNGSVDIVPDTSFDPLAEPDRNVILYGHREMNTAWEALAAAAPVDVRRNLVRIGSRELRDGDLACLFVFPRPGSSTASVGVVAGSGLPGLRLAQRLPYFISGAGFPDCLVLGPEALSEGNPGIVAAGFFENDWTVGDDFAWGPRTMAARE